MILGNAEESKITDQNGGLTLADFDDNNDNNEVTLKAGKKRAGVVQLVHD